MKIKWIKNVELTVYETETEYVCEKIRINDVDLIDIIDSMDNTVTIQFENGCVAYNVYKDWFQTM